MFGVSRESENPVRRHQRKVVVNAPVAADRGPFVIVQPGAPQPAVVQLEAERFDEMQSAAGVGAQPYNVPGVAGNLWLEQGYVKQKVL